MKPTTETCQCKFASKEKESEARKQFLLTEGDDLSEAVVDEMARGVSLGKWVTKCKCHRHYYNVCFA